MKSLGLANAMFRQLRTHIANNPDGAGDTSEIAETLKGSNSVVQCIAGVSARDNPIADKGVEKRRNDGRARVT